MKIAFDTAALGADFKAHAQRGTGRYVYELQRYFRREAKKLRSEGIDIRPFVSSELVQGLPRKVLNHLPLGKVTVEQQLFFPLALSRSTGRAALSGVDFIHFPAHLDAPSWCGRPYLVTVLDLIPLIFPDLYGAKEKGWRFRLARKLELQAIRSAKFLLAISETTANDIVRLLGVPREQIRVTPLAVNEEFCVAPEEERETLRKKLGIEQRQALLYVGGIDQRKNIPFLLESFAELLHAGEGEEAPRFLYMAGSIQGDDQYRQFCNVRDRLGIADRIVELGYVPDEELVCWYQAADLFVFPSLYEGFGLPPLEAMACGCPVLSSNSSCLPEVLDEAAVFASPENKAEFVAGMKRVLEERDLQKMLRELGPEQASRFSWERTGRSTVDAYRLAALFGKEEEQSPNGL